MEPQPDQPTPGAPSRRSLITKGALATGAAWAAPLFTSVPAAAQVGSWPGQPLAFIFQFGIQGTGAGQFDGPTGVAIDSNDRIIVADTANHRVQVFNSAGTHVTTIGGPGAGSALGMLDSPLGVAVDASDRIYVADTGNDRVQIFQSGGAFVAWFGESGNGVGEFSAPSGVAVDSTGRIVVVDTGNHRIQVFEAP